VTFNADHALTLAAEAEEDERNATPGPWGTRAERMRPRAIVIAGTEQVADCAEHTHWTDVQCERNAAAIVRMRNRNPQVASMLRAAVARVEELEAETRAVRMTEADLFRMPMSDLDHHKAELLAMLTDRDSLRAKLAEVEKELDEARENACTRHVATCHGGEAEELRRGIEDIIKNTDWKDMRTELLRLLDDVCARDSLAILEKLDAAEHRATQAEAALGEMTKERDWAVAVQRAALESQERLGTTLAAALQAKEEACDIFARNFEGSIIEDDYKRITELRSVGKEKP
jgi:hypothetical protein